MEEDDIDDGAIGIGEALDIPGGENEDIHGPSSKHHQTTRAKMTHGKKKTVRCNLPTMIIPKEIAAQLGYWRTDHFTSVESYSWDNFNRIHLQQ